MTVSCAICGARFSHQLAIGWHMSAAHQSARVDLEAAMTEYPTDKTRILHPDRADGRPLLVAVAFVAALLGLAIVAVAS